MIRSSAALSPRTTINTCEIDGMLNSIRALEVHGIDWRSVQEVPSIYGGFLIGEDESYMSFPRDKSDLGPLSLSLSVCL